MVVVSENCEGRVLESKLFDVRGEGVGEEKVRRLGLELAAGLEYICDYDKGKFEEGFVLLLLLFFFSLSFFLFHLVF